MAYGHPSAMEIPTYNTGKNMKKSPWKWSDDHAQRWAYNPSLTMVTLLSGLLNTKSSPKIGKAKANNVNPGLINAVYGCWKLGGYHLSITLWLFGEYPPN